MAKSKAKTQLKIGQMASKKKQQAAKIMDKIRRKHKIRDGEKTTTQIIRYFRERL